MGELKKKPEIGEFVYQKIRYPGRDEYWYLPHRVEKVTTKQIHIVECTHFNTIIVSRAQMERSGFAISQKHGMVFYIDLPEEYRKKTLGYVMDRKPREVLGLPDFFTKDQLREAYREKALATHPDRGGSEKEFLEVQEAYEHLDSIVLPSG